MDVRDEKLRSLIAEQAAEWHVSHQDGGLDPDQAQAFMRWLRTSPVHVAEYLAIASIERDLAEAARASATPLENLLAEDVSIVRSLRPDRQLPDHRAEVSSPRGHRARKETSLRSRKAPWSRAVRWAGVAAALMLLSIIVFAGYRYASEPSVAVFATAHGEARSFQLSDDTAVHLDSDSSIAVVYGRHQRRVTVNRGQAYFEVAKDPTRPFSVRAGSSLIRDIGTAFDVYRRGTSTTITVAEGRVQVWRAPPAQSTNLRWLPWGGNGAPSGKPIVTLDAGEQALIADSGGMRSKGSVDLRQALAWTRGEITFDHRSIASVAAEFNQYNDAQITVADPDIGVLPISGTFGAHDVTTFVAFLESMPGVHVERHGQHVIIRASSKGKRHHG